VYPARCPNPSCASTFISNYSGSVNCPVCGTRTDIVLEVAATVDAPPVPRRRNDHSATLDVPLAQPTDEPSGRIPFALPAIPSPSRSAPGTASVPASIVPPLIGRFQVRAKLGAGAFGEVYRAHDPQLDREVALKVAKPGTLDSPERVGRFLREARAAANLRHPNIVPVFDSGRDGDRHYIASGFIDGRTLEAEIEAADGKSLDLRRGATIIRQLAEALGYAHKQGVVHRDVKPANVLVDVTGEPSLTDFGLAVRAGDEAVKTQDGKVMGTPAYMSPEQAGGKSAEATAASDQYALGIMLYEMATGGRPFEGPMELVMFQQIQVEPRRPRSENRAVPRDLETIILKCLEKDAGKRYLTCEALAEDLRRWLEGEPVTARRIGPVERFGRWAKRNPTVAGSLVSVVVVSVLGGTVSYANYREARIQQGFAERDAAEAKRQEEIAIGQTAEAKRHESIALQQAEQARQQASRAETVSGFMRELFIASDPTGLTGSGLIPPGEGGRTVTAAELLTRGSQQIRTRLKDDPLTRAALMGTIGEVSRMLGLFDQSLPLLNEALQIRRQLLPPEHPDIAASLFHLANWHAEKGNFIESEKLYDEAIAFHRRRGTLDSLEGAEVHMRLAALLASISDPRAVETARACLATREKLLGGKHRETAIARLVLAACLFEGNPTSAEAIRQITEALDYLKLVDGAQKDGVLAGTLEFQGGYLMRGLGFHAQAEKKFRTALDLTTRALGANHVYIQVIRHELGVTLAAKGDTAGAEQLFKEALAVGRATIGMEHPKTLVLLISYANLLVNQNRHKEAYALFTEALQAVERRYGKQAPWRVDLLLGAALLATGAKEQRAARTHIADALSALADPDFRTTRRTVNILSELAHVIPNLNDLALTRKVYGVAFAHEQRHPVPEYRWQLNHNFGATLVEAKRYAEGEPHLREAARLFNEHPEIQSGRRPSFAYCLVCLGKAAWAAGRFDEAESLFVEAAAQDRQGTAQSATESLIILVATQQRFAELRPHLERESELSGRSELDRVWNVQLEVASCLLSGDRVAAADALERLEQQFGRSTERDVAMYRAWGVWLAGGDARVRAEIERLRKLADPTSEPALLALAACHLKVNQPTEALAVLPKFAAPNPRTPKSVLRDTLKALAEYRANANGTTRAQLLATANATEQFLRTFTVTSPTYSGYSASLLANLVVLHAQVLDEVRPANLAPPPRSAAPTDARGHLELGIALWNKGRTRPALTALKEAVRLDPNDALACDWLAYALLGTNDPKAALPFAQEAVKLDPNVAQAHWNLGRARAGTGDLDGSLVAFRETVKRHPNNPIYKTSLNDTLKEKTERDRNRGKP
jgi:tetratricopeptide (TPR) repeat protein/tRNA A-37 threonylcarbamoyl transferase component Bud32